jgi:hypothetical protein
MLALPIYCCDLMRTTERPADVFCACHCVTSGGSEPRCGRSRPLLHTGKAMMHGDGKSQPARVSGQRSSSRTSRRNRVVQAITALHDPSTQHQDEAMPGPRPCDVALVLWLPVQAHRTCTRDRRTRRRQGRRSRSGQPQPACSCRPDRAHR